MFEDVFLAVYISILSGLVLSDSSSVGGVIMSALIALGFMLNCDYYWTQSYAITEQIA